MSYGVYESEEAYDLAVAELHESFRVLVDLADRAGDKAEILAAEQGGNTLGGVVDVLTDGIDATIAKVNAIAQQAQRIASMVDLIPDAELGSHKALVLALARSVVLLASFVRGFTEGTR